MVAKSDTDMKLTTRLSIATAALAILLFGAGGAIVLRSEEQNLREAAERETLILGRSLQVAFKNALRDRQIEDIGETLSALSQIRPDADIFVYDEDGKLVASSEGAAPSAGISALQQRARSGPEAPRVEFAPATSSQVIRVALHLRHETAEKTSILVLERPLKRMLRELDNARRSIGLLVGGFVVAVSCLVVLMMRTYVGRPLAELIEGMRRVRGGTFPELSPAPHRNDEVGEAQREFDVLTRQLNDAHVRLEAELDARRRTTRALEAADKLITLGQMSAVLAHEIGSPLQILEGRARALLKNPDKPSQIRRTAEIVVEQAERITKIVSQMLDITRRPAAIRRDIDPVSVVRSVLELVEFEARRRGLQVVLDVDGGGTVSADPDQLQQIVLNLCRNAFDAAPTGSKVRFRVVRGKHHFLLEVQDQGSGIPEPLKPHLFEPFFTTKTNQGGSGLGLSVVKSLVQEHGGEVLYASSQSGTTFTVVLPTTAPGESAVEPASRLQQTPGEATP
jgi:signal transduction histidine kinase